MIQINIDMKMPERCGLCRFTSAMDCGITGKFIEDHNIIPSDCPLKEVPTGKWIDKGHLYHHYYNDGDIETVELQCSCCGEIVEWDIELLHKPYYCENCGAKMVEDQQGENT